MQKDKKLTQYQIREAQILDFETLAQLEKVVWDDFDIPDGKHIWRHWAELAYCWVATHLGEVVVGAVLLLPTRQLDLLWVHKLFVAKEFRSLGVGKELMETALKWSDSKNFQTQLTVSLQNKNAIALYDSLGYEKKLYIDFYGKGKDRYLMRRQPIHFK